MSTVRLTEGEAESRSGGSLVAQPARVNGDMRYIFGLTEIA